MSFVARRALLALGTLAVISVVTFWATNVMPSDPARTALGRLASEEQLQAFRSQQGLDRPPLERYATWLGDVAQGDLGTSTRTRRPVTEEISGRLERTLLLGLLAGLVAVPLALAIGVYSGQRGGRGSDVAISVGSIMLGSLPEFVVGILLLAIFSVALGVLPVESSGAVYGDFGEKVEAYVLPIACLALVLLPYLTRVFRANVRDTLSQPFVRSAVLRGLPARRVVWRHVVPNATLPAINVVALSMAEIVAGAVVIETVFGFPGIGKELVDSVLGKDIPMVQALALVMGGLFVALNFAADAVALALNPKLRVRHAA